MTRHFCDTCGTELDKYNPDVVHRRLKGVFGKLHFEVMVGSVRDDSGAPTWNAGEFCRHCVLDAVALLDDRRRPA